MIRHKTQQEAREAGFLPLTTSFRSHETAMMKGVLADLRRGNIPVALVTVEGGTEIWRASSGYRHTARKGGGR